MTHQLNSSLQARGWGRNVGGMVPECCCPGKQSDGAFKPESEARIEMENNEAFFISFSWQYPKLT